MYFPLYYECRNARYSPDVLYKYSNMYVRAVRNDMYTTNTLPSKSSTIIPGLHTETTAKSYRITGPHLRAHLNH